MRRLQLVLLAAITAPLMTGLAFPAQAAPADPSATGAATAVPDCVLTEVDDDGASDYVIISNACRHTVRVQVLIDNYDDSDCITIRETKSASHHWWYPGRYQGLKNC